MNVKNYARDLRATRDRLATMQKELNDLAAQCTHSRVVTLCSYYGGSYSWDRDDWHPETRQCLICGTTESGGSNDAQHFKQLLNPIRRFEFGDLYRKDSEYVKSPLHHTKLFETSLDSVLKWVNNNGYSV